MLLYTSTFKIVLRNSKIKFPFQNWFAISSLCCTISKLREPANYAEQVAVQFWNWFAISNLCSSILKLRKFENCVKLIYEGKNVLFCASLSMLYVCSRSIFKQKMFVSFAWRVRAVIVMFEKANASFILLWLVHNIGTQVNALHCKALHELCEHGAKSLSRR